MSRWIRVNLPEQLSDEEYADLANVVWMTLYAATINRPDDRGFSVDHDGRTAVDFLNDRWKQYDYSLEWR